MGLGFWGQAKPAAARLALTWVVLLGLCQPVAARVLRVLAWPGYADADIVATFEKRHAVRVEITTVASDEVLRAKLADKGSPGYDLVAANTVEIGRLVAQKQLAPLSLADIPNAARQLPRFRPLQSIAGIAQGGDVFAVPYTYSEMGLVYDRGQFKTAPQSLSVLWDPRYQGRVLAFADGGHGFSLAAMHLGLPPFGLAGGQFRAAALDLVALRRNVRAFYSLPEESVELFRKHKVAVMHANYGQQQLKQLRDAGLDVGYVVPREGALAWLDCWAVTRRSSQVALATQWINYMLDPQVSAELTRRQGLANTLAEPPDLAAGGVLGPVVWLEPVEDTPRRAQLWQRIVSGDRPARF